MRLTVDVRVLFQDQLAPELQSLNARVDGPEKTVDAELATMNIRICSLERETKLRCEPAEERAAARQELMLARLDAFAATIDARFAAIDARFESMEKMRVRPQGFFAPSTPANAAPRSKPCGSVRQPSSHPGQPASQGSNRSRLWRRT